MSRKALLALVFGALSALSGVAVYYVDELPSADTPSGTRDVLGYCTGGNTVAIFTVPLTAHTTGTISVTYSSDGDTWTTADTDLPHLAVGDDSYTPRIFAGNGTIWLSGVDDIVYRSTNLTNWTAVYDDPDDYDVTSIICGPTWSLVTLHGSEAAPPVRIIRSTDGQSWSTVTPPSYNTFDGGFTAGVEVDGVLYAVAQHIEAASIYSPVIWSHVIWSTDDGGTTWTQEELITQEYGAATFATTLNGVPAFGLILNALVVRRGAQDWATVDVRGPDAATIYRRLGHRISPLPDYEMAIAPYIPIGAATLYGDVVVGCRPATGVWVLDIPQAGLFWDGSTLTNLELILSPRPFGRESYTKIWLGETLVPFTSQVFDAMADSNDVLYLGATEPFQRLDWDVVTPGDYTDFQIAYSTASGWNTLSATDTTNGLEQDGTISWDVPGDWARASISGQPAVWKPLYWIKLSAASVAATARVRLVSYQAHMRQLYQAGFVRLGYGNLSVWHDPRELTGVFAIDNRVFGLYSDPAGDLPILITEVR